MSGSNSYTGVTTINAGTLSVATINNGGVAGNLGRATSAAGNLVLGGGTLQYTGATASTNRAFTLTNGTTSSFDVSTGGTNLTISGAAAATTGGLTKIGGGTLTLSGANGYTGLTTVSAGTLAYGANNALSSGAVTVSGGTLSLGTFTDTVGTVTLSSGSITGGVGGTLTSTGTFEMQSGTVSGILAGSGIAMNKTTAGTVTFSGANTFTGLTTVSAGTLAYGANNALSSGAVTVSGGTLSLGTFTDTVGTVTLSSGSITGGVGGTLTSTGTFEMQSGTVSGILAGSGIAMNKTTAGTVTLSGANTFTGLTTVSAGTLAYGINDALSTGGVTASGGTLSLGTFSDTVGTVTVSGGGSITGSSGVLSSTGNFEMQNGSVSGILGGLSLLNKTTASTVTLSGVNTYTGGTTIGAGTLALSGSGTLGSTSGTLTVNGGTLDLAGVNAGVGNFTGSGGTVLTNGANATLTIGNSNGTGGNFLGTFADGTGGVLSLTKTGSGTLTLGGASSNTYSGTTTVNGGTLALAKSGGTVAVSGNLTIGDGTGTDTARLDAANQIGSTSTVTFNNSGGTPTLNLNGYSQTLGSIASTNTSAQVQLGAPGSATALTVGDSSNTTFAGVISGGANASLVKEGSGTLTLSGTNTFTGAVAINAGTLAVQNNAGLGAGTLGTTVSSGATLSLLGGVTVVNGTLSLTGTSGVGALTNVSGDNVWNGDVTLTGNTLITTQAGTLTLGPTNPYTFTPSGTNPATETGYVTIGGQTLTFGGAGTNIQVYDRIRDFVGQTDSTRYSYPPLTLAQAPETTNPGNVVVNMSGGGSVTFSANANSYTGSTTVQAGTLILDTVDNTAAQHDTVTNTFHSINGSLIIGDGTGSASSATVRLSTGYPVNETISMSSAITLYKDGLLDINGQSQTIGSLTFNGGAVNLNSGTLYLDQDVTVNASAGNTATINGTGNLSLTLRRTGGVDVLPDATRTFTVTGGVGNTYDLSITGNIQSGNLVKAGNGTMMLGTTHSTYVGTTSVTGGILNIQQGTDVSTRSSLGSSNGLASQGTAVSSGATLQIQGGIAVTNEYLSIAGGGFNPGDGVLGALNNHSGNNTWGTAGNTYINLDAAARINSKQDTLTIAGNIASTGNQALTFGGAGNTTVSGGINTGTGSSTTVTKDGAGTLILSGSNNFEGVTNVMSGIVSVQHNNGLGSLAAGTVVSSGAELQLSKVNGITIGGEALTLNGAGIGGASGALNNVLANNSFGGVVTLNSASTIKSTAGTLTLLGGITSTNQNLTIAGAGNITVTAGITNGTGTLTKNDAGTFTFAGNVNGTTGTVGAASLLAGSMVVGNGTETTTLNTAAFDSAAGTTLTIASGGTVVADYASGSTNFDGALAGAGTFQKNGAGTLVFGNSFTATNLTLVLHGGTLSLTGVQITVGTIHITASTTLDFNNSNGTVLNSSHLVIDNGVVVTVNNWISAANDAAASTIWYATSTVNSGTLAGAQQFGGTPLSQINFTGYTPALTTTWTTAQNGWFEHEIRPTPEPQTYGAIFLSSCFGLLGWRRWRQRRAAA